MPIIDAQQLTKTYQVADKAPGFLGTLRHFVQRRFRTVTAVRDLSFAIEPGEVVGFLDPNGAGKTTTLKMLTGLICPSGGQATVAGHRPFRRDAAFLRRITMVMGQKQQLIWDLPTLDSLRINGAVYDIPAAECRRRIGDLAGMLGLESQLSQPVRKLSLGERMKAELLAALLHRPDVLFLDEPTLGLDVNAQASVREFLREYNRLHQATVILTSHYMADITALCRRVVIIHAGQLLYDGSLDGIVRRLAPYREVRLDLARPVPAERLAAYGEVASVEGHAVRLAVERSQLTAVIARLLGDLEVRDLTINDPPIEETIGRIFRQPGAAP